MKKFEIKLQKVAYQNLGSKIIREIRNKKVSVYAETKEQAKKFVEETWKEKGWKIK